MEQITDIYHNTKGRLGHRKMRIFLARKGIKLSKTTVHKYMNKELELRSLLKRKKPGYSKGQTHKVFPDLLKQNFRAEKVNQKWCTDFTYLFLEDGRKRYNCSIIDLYDRSVIASLNGKVMNADLAINTLKKALSSQPVPQGGLILHSDQGSQYTSKAFTEFCESVNLTQSMSKAGCPYDNAPMERYFNTFKSELIYQHHFRSDKDLDSATEEYIFLWYNHLRPHSYNNGLTPFEARFHSKNIRSHCYNFA